ARVNDALFEIDVGKRNVQVQTAAFQRVGNFACVVAGQEDEGRFGLCFDRADFRNRNLEVRQDLEQQRFEFVVRLVDFVDQQNAAMFFLERFEQRARFNEFLGKENVAELVEA